MQKDHAKSTGTTFSPYATVFFANWGAAASILHQVLQWLDDRRYDGYVLVEQDVLPGMGAPRDSALRNREYLRSLEHKFA